MSLLIKDENTKNFQTPIRQLCELIVVLHNVSVVNFTWVICRTGVIPSAQSTNSDGAQVEPTSEGSPKCTTSPDKTVKLKAPSEVRRRLEGELPVGNLVLAILLIALLATFFIFRSEKVTKTTLIHVVKKEWLFLSTELVFVEIVCQCHQS